MILKDLIFHADNKLFLYYQQYINDHKDKKELFKCFKKYSKMILKASLKKKAIKNKKSSSHKIPHQLSELFQELQKHEIMSSIDIDYLNNLYKNKDEMMLAAFEVYKIEKYSIYLLYIIED